MQSSPGRGRALAVSILGASSLTVFSGAALAAALPAIETEHLPQTGCALLARLVLTLPAAAIALGAPVAGVLVDRFGKRRLMIGALLGYAAFGTAGLWVSGLAALLVSRALLGVTVAVVMTVATALIGDHFDGAARRRFLGFQGATMSLAGMFGLVVGGALADVSWRAPFAVYALALIVVPFALAAVHDAEGDAETGTRGSVAAPRPVAPQIPLSALFAVYGLAFSAMTLFYMVPVQLPFVLARVMSLGGAATGIVIAGATLVAAVTAAQYRNVRDHLSEYGISALLLALMGAGYALIALAPGVAVVGAAMLMVGAGVGLLVPHCNNWVLCLVPSAARGRALGGLNSAFFAGQFVSPLVAAPLLAWAGLQGQFVVAGAILATAALVFAMLTRVHARLA